MRQPVLFLEKKDKTSRESLEVSGTVSTYYIAVTNPTGSGDNGRYYSYLHHLAIFVNSVLCFVNSIQHGISVCSVKITSNINESSSIK